MNLKLNRYNTCLKTSLLAIIQIALLFLVCNLLLSHLYSFNSQHQVIGTGIIEQQLFGTASDEHDIPALYNSDLIEPYLIVQDVLQNLYALCDWTFSPALYAFPDWLISLPLILFGITNKLLPIFYGSTLLSLDCLTAGMLVAKCSQSSVNLSGWAWTWIITLIISALGGFILMCPQSRLSYYMLVWLGTSYIHSGAVLMTLVSLLCWLYILHPQNRAQKILAIWLLSGSIFFTSFSDFIFVVWFVLPVSLVTLLHQWNIKKYAGRPFFWLIIPSLLAIGLEVILRHQSPGSRAHQTGSLMLWISDLVALVDSADYPMLIVLLLNALLLLRACIIVKSLIQKNPIKQSDWVELLLASIAFFAIATPLLLHLYRGYALWRYSLIIFILPPIWIALSISRHIQTKTLTHLGLGAFSLLLTATYLAFPQASITIKSAQKPSALESCLLQNKLTAGYGDYWNAKSLIFLSNRQIHIAQLTESAQAELFNFNRAWFITRSDNGQAFKPNFVMMQGLDPVAIEQLFGEPQSTLRCQQQLIWSYDHELPKVAFKVR